MTTTKITKAEVKKRLHFWLSGEFNGVTDDEAVVVIEILVKAEIKNIESKLLKMKEQLKLIEDSK